MDPSSVKPLELTCPWFLNKTNAKLLSGDPGLPVLALPDSAPTSCLHTSGYLRSLYSARVSSSRSEILSSCRLSSSAPGSCRLELLPPRGSPPSFPAPVFCISHLCLGRFHPLVMTGVCQPSTRTRSSREQRQNLMTSEQQIVTKQERGAITKGGWERGVTCPLVGITVASAHCWHS